MSSRHNTKLKVTFSSFRVASTYAGLMEGSRAYASKMIREELVSEYPMDAPNNGYALVIAEDGPLPPWRCTASISSRVKIEPDGDRSDLEVCWFLDEVDKPIQELVDDVATLVDWHARARSFSYDWL